MKSERAFLTLLGVTERQIRTFDAKYKPTVPGGDALQHRLWCSTPQLVLVQPSTSTGRECKPGEFVLRHLQSPAVIAVEPLGSRLRVKVRDVRFKGIYHRGGESQQFSFDHESQLGSQIMTEASKNSPENPTLATWGPEWLLECDGKAMRWYVHHLHARIESIALLDSEESIIQSQSYNSGKSPYFLSKVFAAPRQEQA